MEFESDEHHFSKEKLISFSYSNSPSPSSSSSLHKPHPQMTSSWLSQPVDLLTSRLNSVNDEDDEESGARRGEGPPQPPAPVEKEHMFDKVVTPSDVGKLNRLVIPKQHAERYFPLDSTSNEKGLLLNFEDRTGKSWRFRYSYWNSSQSYVMTKGWSRFVKDKKLDAGDIVSFQRGMGDSVKDRFFIDWRRRPDSAPEIHRSHFQQHHYLPSIPWSPLLMRPPAVYGSGGRSSAYGGFNCANSGAFVYMKPAAAPVVQWPQLGGGAAEPMVYESVPVVQGKAAAKRLRLFGVNMDCPIPADSEQCENPISSSSSLQLKLYNGTPMQPPSQILHKGKSSMSFDLDI